PSPLSPLPADQQAWADSLVTNDDDELQEKIYYLNRPDKMPDEERTRNRWASALISQWLELLKWGHLKAKD
ncbi:MAG: hypothetical protein Q9198_004127, partial [Flavoplaca austrocitrina]